MAVVWLIPAAAWPCTTFLVSEGDGVWLGKTYDWHMGQGVVLANRRGVAKQALPLGPDVPPARWVSRFASVTFNQYGWEMPNGGMNEAGLVVEIMWLADSRYPAPDGRPSVNELQVIQYYLDSFASVAELVAAAPTVRVGSIYGKVHYLACDPTGACATLELLDGRLVVHSGADLPVKVLTNDTYASSLAYLGRYQGFGGERAGPPRGLGSLERFARAAFLSTGGRAPGPEAAFHILDSVSVPDYTQWRIVYAPGQGRVQFRTLAQPRIKEVDARALADSCRAPVQAIDIDLDATGDVTPRFAPFTTADNARLIAAATADLAEALPPGLVQQAARYPATLPCQAP